MFSLENSIAEMEDPLVNNTADIESHPEKENPAIIIEIRDNQIVNQESYVEKPATVSDELRNYFSNITGLESSPDGKLNAMKSDHASVINLITPDGGISESCRISNGPSDRMVLNSDAVLFPIDEGIPMSIIAKGSEFQICKLFFDASRSLLILDENFNGVFNFRRNSFIDISS